MNASKEKQLLRKIYDVVEKIKAGKHRYYIPQKIQRSIEFLKRPRGQEFLRIFDGFISMEIEETRAINIKILETIWNKFKQIQFIEEKINVETNSVITKRENIHPYKAKAIKNPMKTRYNVGDVFHTLNENNDVMLNIIYSVNIERNDDKDIRVIYGAIPLRQEIILKQTGYYDVLQKYIKDIIR